MFRPLRYFIANEFLSNEQGTLLPTNLRYFIANKVLYSFLFYDSICRLIGLSWHDSLPLFWQIFLILGAVFRTRRVHIAPGGEAPNKNTPDPAQ